MEDEVDDKNHMGTSMRRFNLDERKSFCTDMEPAQAAIFSTDNGDGYEDGLHWRFKWFLVFVSFAIWRKGFSLIWNQLKLPSWCGKIEMVMRMEILDVLCLESSLGNIENIQSKPCADRQSDRVVKVAPTCSMTMAHCSEEGECVSAKNLHDKPKTGQINTQKSFENAPKIKSLSVSNKQKAINASTSTCLFSICLGRVLASRDTVGKF